MWQIHRFWLTGFLTCFVAGLPLAAGADVQRPNFVVFLIDDLGWTDLGCYGSDLYQTPAIDQLARDGLRFTNAYAACTVCSPTRAALMTGKYPARLRVTDWIPGHVHPYAKLRVPNWTMRLEHRHTTVAEALKAAGYKTAHVGKWHLMPPSGPDMWSYDPTHHGFDINIGGNQWGSPGSYFHPYARPDGSQRVEPLPPGGQAGEYLTDRLTDEAIRILREWKTGPFFLYFAHYAVHTPLQAKKPDIDRFQGLIWPTMRHKNPTYAAMIWSVDQSVGRIRRVLEELGLADQTVIIFTSDNGGLNRRGSGDPTDNAPLREGKGTAYEGGVRVPTIISWPGVTARNATSDVPIITMDLYPTILELAGVPLPNKDKAEIDGLSLVPILKDPKAQLSREALYWHYPHYHTMGATPYSAIRAGDWRLIEFFEDGHAELYNLRQDIGETRDLSHQYPDKVKELRSKLQAWRKAVGAQLPTPNPQHDPKRASELAR